MRALAGPLARRNEKMRGINVAEETLIGDINWLRVIGMFVCIIFFIVAIPHIYTYIKKLAGFSHKV